MLSKVFKNHTQLIEALVGDNTEGLLQPQMMAKLGVGLTNLRRALGNFGMITRKIDASQTLKKNFLASLASFF